LVALSRGVRHNLLAFPASWLDPGCARHSRPVSRPAADAAAIRHQAAGHLAARKRL